jgi:phosphotransferase system enzyme I (PtsI)
VSGESRERTLLQGLGASPGMALGHAHVLASRELNVTDLRVAPEQVGSEIRRFRRGLREAREEIRALRRRLGKGPRDPGDQILGSHLLILEDRELVQEIVAAIKNERWNAPRAAHGAFLAKAEYLESLASEVFRGRAADVRDVLGRLLARLLGAAGSSIAEAPPGSIVVAREIAPSETVALGPQGAAGVVTEQGTLMSHVTILARSRGVPAVIAVPDALKTIRHQERILIDGEQGVVICSPAEEDIRRYESIRQRERRQRALLAGREHEPGATRDGKRVPVGANIGRPEEAVAASQSGAECIGLFRTEFLLINGGEIPSEEVQFRHYCEVARAFAGRRVTIRILDLGGDKVAGPVGTGGEENPFLGLRGIRFCFEHPDVFLAQVRAILRASSAGNLQFLIPMVSGIGELRETRALILRTAEQLRNEGHALAARVPIGVMIEVPSAVWMSDLLAREADYFSIGSNDLIQYCLAVDRGNARVAHLYEGLDPAVLRAVDQTVRNGHAAGIRVASCGEMSGELPGLLLLVGLGVDELSVAPFLVARVKGILAGVEAAALARMTRRCLAASVVEEVRAIVREELRVYPQLRFEERDGQFVCLWDPEGA